MCIYGTFTRIIAWRFTRFTYAQELGSLTERLSRINEELARKMQGKCAPLDCGQPCFLHYCFCKR